MASRNLRGRLVCRGALLLAAACALPVTACGSGTSPTTATTTSTSNITEATTAAAAFPVLGRTTLTSADLALRAAAHQMANGDSNAQPAKVRSAYSDNHFNVGVMPDGVDKACVIAVTRVGTSGGCMCIRDTYKEGLTVGFNDRDGYHLVGVLPSGLRGIAVVTRDGTHHHPTLSTDHGFAFVSHEPLVSVTVTTTGGTTRSNRLPPSSGSRVANPGKEPSAG